MPNSIFKETNGKLDPFLKLFGLMKENHMNIAQVINAVDIAANSLPYMENLYEHAKDEVNKMQRTRQSLLRDIETKYKISILDKTVFCIDQERRRKD